MAEKDNTKKWSASDARRATQELMVRARKLQAQADAGDPPTLVDAGSGKVITQALEHNQGQELGG